MVKPSKSMVKPPEVDDEPPKSPIWRAAHMQQAQELAPWCLTAGPAKKDDTSKPEFGLEFFYR